MEYEYKVAELSKKQFLTGRVGPKDVEALINEMAKQGWEFASLTSQSGIGVSSAVLAVFRRPVRK